MFHVKHRKSERTKLCHLEQPDGLLLQKNASRETFFGGSAFIVVAASCFGTCIAAKKPERSASLKPDYPTTPTSRAAHSR